jgi:hypothetical protein
MPDNGMHDIARHCTAYITARRSLRARGDALMDDGLAGRYFEMLWLCALAAWLALTAYGRILPGIDAQSGEPIRTAYSTTSGNIPFPGPRWEAAGDAQPMPANLAVYLELHRSRDQRPAPIEQHANLCSP